MKILLIIDQFDAENNGTTISAKRFAKILKSRGHEVRVVSTGNNSEDKYAVKEWRIPVFGSMVESQGMAFAFPNRNTLEQAISWADIVHFLMPFALSIEGLIIAHRLHVPHTAAFHVQPENITSSIGLKNSSLINKAIYLSFRDIFYNHFTHIHCPSRFIAQELKKNGYTAQLHIISNGIEPDFCYKKTEKTVEYKNKILIVMIGRLSAEKRQDVIIDAVSLSKYADRIQLVFAGQGPKMKDLEKAGEKLINPPYIHFFSKEELIQLLSMTDLYIHAADVEIEAISCIEAFASGLVPIIADSPKSATPQFALDERSLFLAGRPDDLVVKIDYWLDHPEEKKEMEILYGKEGKKYNIEHCVAQIEEMFLSAISEYGN
jgi:glycosyltransferase involved in cell wall biosynthesis